MPKKIVQDIYIVKKSIKATKKKGISSICIEERKIEDNFVSKLPSESEVDNISFDECNNEEEKRHVTKDSLIFLWIICIISLATLIFFLSSMFATATLTITPRNQIVALNDTYNIFSDKNVAGLHYQVMTIKKDLSKTLETDGEEYVERKATGKAILYNNFSTSKQRLINNTRLETKDGLTYRIRESADIPGTTIVGGVKTPGSVEVEIIADMPGDKYNMKLTDLKGDFTIPGFKGSTKYTTFYGRLSSDVSGGFIGNVKKVSDDKLVAGKEELKTTLKNDLIKDVYSKTTEQYVLFKDNYYTQCNDLADDSASSEFKISEECSVNAIIFNKSELALFIAKNKIKDFDNSKIDIAWNDSDVVSLQSVTEKPWNETTLKAKFVGPAFVIWTYDVAGILDSIVGQDRTIINAVIQGNKNSVTEILASIRPMWRNTFPESVKKIKIVDTIREGLK